MSLVELRVRHLAVVRDAVVPVPAGFIALTGETGAGKSVCITALRLALGGRVDGDPLSQGEEAAHVTAVFDDVPAAVRERLIAVGVPDDEPLTLSRELSRSGRGWCRVNGALVSLAVLREVGEALAEITVQGASHRLLQRRRQREVLDLAAGTVELRGEVRDAVARWRQAGWRLLELERMRAAGEVEVGAARALIEDIAPLRLMPGEEAPLQAERLRLRHATALLAANDALRRASLGDEDTPGAVDLLVGALDAARAVSGVDPELDALAIDAEHVAEQVRELGVAARHRCQTVAVDEPRLGDVEARLDVLSRVRRRHGSLEDALAALAAAEELLAARSGSGEALVAAEAALVEARSAAGALAARLSGLRKRGARRLEVAVEAALHRLELPHARFRVALDRRADGDGVEVDGATVRCGGSGVDEVEFRLSANRGAAPAALEAGPSGGELSRLVLALASCVRETGSPLLVLDEVDAGIGGETAARVGDLLAATGRHRQVVAVTHRAEIASRADCHLLVRKVELADRTAASVIALDGEERIGEIARLMSGRVTEAAMARAVELRGEAIDTIPPVAASLARQRQRR